MEDLPPVIVIDNGTTKLRAGLAGDDEPHAILYSDVTKTDPMKQGIIEDWDAIEQIWAYTFDKLKVDPRTHTVLLTEACMNPKANREKMTQIMFEKFNCPTMYVANRSVLALYSGGRTTGVVVDLGQGASHVVPVYEGNSLPHATIRHDVTGDFVTSYMGTILAARDINLNVTQNANVKETLCYTALDYHKELPNVEEKLYTLPDGNRVTIKHERIICPEALFRPETAGVQAEGIHKAVISSVLKCDEEIRKKLYASVVLSGGTTLFPNFHERFQTELERAVPGGTKLKVVGQAQRHMASWLGGSTLASFPMAMKNTWISRQEYDTTGPSIVHRKCFQ